MVTEQTPYTLRITTTEVGSERITTFTMSVTTPRVFYPSRTQLAEMLHRAEQDVLSGDYELTLR